MSVTTTPHNFNKVMKEVKKRLKRYKLDKVCVDRKDEAMKAENFEEAVNILVDDTLYWEGKL